MTACTLHDARAAKQKLAQRLATVEGIVGVGITKRDGQYAVKVNLSRPLTDSNVIPNTVDGVPIYLELVGPIRARSTPHQDWIEWIEQRLQDGNIISHAEARVAPENGKGTAEPREVATFLHQLMVMAYQAGADRTAEALASEARGYAEANLGQDAPETFTSMNDLAFLYARHHDEKAEPLYQRALAGRQRVLGEDHPDTLRTGTIWRFCIKVRAVTKKPKPSSRKPSLAANACWVGSTPIPLRAPTIWLACIRIKAGMTKRRLYIWMPLASVSACWAGTTCEPLTPRAIWRACM